MSLRIIAGEYGGRSIQAPPGRGTRPTRSRVREAWFSALADRIEGARVLDLFAGSGALGLEALSRGASHACFVESNRRVVAVLRANIERLGASGRATVRPVDAFRVVEEATKDRTRAWDIVLADPPYAGGDAKRLAADFDRAPFGSILCVEHAPGVHFPREPDWCRRYGERWSADSVFHYGIVKPHDLQPSYECDTQNRSHSPHSVDR